MTPSNDNCNQGHRLVLTTCGDMDSAEQLAESLVEQRLAACVNIVPNIRSVYRWQGKIEKDSEYLLIIKTTLERIESLQSSIQSLHRYELPEIVVVCIEQGLPEYLEWIGTSVRETHD